MLEFLMQAIDVTLYVIFILAPTVLAIDFYFRFPIIMQEIEAQKMVEVMNTTGGGITLPIEMLEESKSPKVEISTILTKGENQKLNKKKQLRFDEVSAEFVGRGLVLEKFPKSRHRYKVTNLHECHFKNLEEAKQWLKENEYAQLSLPV